MNGPKPKLMPPSCADCSLAAAAARMTMVSEDIAGIKATLAKLTDAVGKLAVLEERQTNNGQALGRAFTEIGELKQRVAQLEQAQPLQRQASDWIQKIVWLALAAVAGALITGVVRPAHSEPKAPVPIIGQP